KAAALARAALHHHITIVTLGNHLDEAQAQPNPANGAGFAPDSPCVAIEHAPDQLRRNAAATVTHLATYPVVLHIQAHIHTGALVAVLDGIRQKVDHQALKQLMVTVDPDVIAWLIAEAHHHASRLCLRLHLVQRALHHREHV